VLPRQLISTALAETATRLESGYGSEIKKREERLRLAFADALRSHEEVVEARISPEWRPEMPFWPWSDDGKAKLGGFDVAIRFRGDDSYSLVVELKWTHYGFVNALDEVPWDAFKLAQASATLQGVMHGLLVYLAPTKAWTKPARFASLFGDYFANSRTLIAEHEKIWRWCLKEGSASHPTKLPPALQTGPVGSASLTIDGEPWELRAAVVRANGEPWIDLDEEVPVPEAVPLMFDWPYPEPGPGMVADDPAKEFHWPTYDITEVLSEELSLSDVPRPNATWNEITWFAAHFNGYEHYGNKGVSEMANASVRYWDDYRKIDDGLDLDKLRGCLFFESRRYHHFSHAPGADDTPYLRALVEAIRTRVAARADLD
jgi:hypothetical protein